MADHKCFHYFSIGFLIANAFILLVVMIEASMTDWDRTRFIALFIQHFMVIFVIYKLIDQQSQQLFVNWMLMLSASLFFPCLFIQIIGSIQSQEYKQAVSYEKIIVFQFFHSTYLYIYFQILIYGGLLFLLSLIIFLVRKYRDMEYRSRIDEVIDGLQTIQYALPQAKKENQSVEIHQCSICLVSFELKEEIYKLNCGHYFHKNCLLDWLKHKLICPLDRIPLHPEAYLETQQDQ